MWKKMYEPVRQVRGDLLGLPERRENEGAAADQNHRYRFQRI